MTMVCAALIEIFGAGVLKIESKKFFLA